MSALARSPALAVPYLECETAAPTPDTPPRIAAEAIVCRRREAAMNAPNRASTAPLLDIAALAERLNVTTRFVRRLIDTRRVPYLKVGKFIRFDPADIDQWLDAKRIDQFRAD
jgi:excisionase family DNA binding protein